MPDILYTNVEGPADIRRGILGLSKDIIKTLQSYEILKEIRADKAKEIIVLKNIIDELKVLEEMLNEKLPYEELKQKKPEKKQIVKLVTRTKKSALDKLEQELSEIESRISDIS